MKQPSVFAYSLVRREATFDNTPILSYLVKKSCLDVVKDVKDLEREVQSVTGRYDYTN